MSVMIPPFARRVSRIIYGFLLGYGITGGLVALMKLSTYAPRPHFLQLCSAGEISCTKGSFWKVSEHCSSTGESVKEALRAFPSYHAALATYSGLFTSAYIISTARVRGIYSGPLLLLSSIAFITYLGVTNRYLTGHSSASDIIAGTIIGASIVWIVSKYTMSGAYGKGEESKNAEVDYIKFPSSIETFPIIPRAVPFSSHPTALAKQAKLQHAVNSSISSTSSKSAMPEMTGQPSPKQPRARSFKSKPVVWFTKFSNNSYSIPGERDFAASHQKSEESHSSTSDRDDKMHTPIYAFESINHISVSNSTDEQSSYF